MVMRVRCGKRSTEWLLAFSLMFSLSPMARDRSGRQAPRTSEWSWSVIAQTPADDWIAEHISAVDVCVTSDIPLASRCLKKQARVISPTGKQFTQANIGDALVGREIARHLRELGTNTRGPAPLTKRNRSQFLSALDTAVQAALREAGPGP